MSALLSKSNDSTDFFHDISVAYTQMFSLAPRMIFASIVAYSISQLLDVRVFSALKIRTQGRWLALRTNAASWSSQLVDTALFTTLFLGGILSPAQLAKTFATAYLTKIFVMTLDSPFVYIGVWGVRWLDRSHTEPIRAFTDEPLL